VLGRGWLSPWVEGGQLCGSRGMALPILGLRVRLRGEAAETFDCEYSATFTDGSSVGPMAAGETCEAESFAPIEAFQFTVRPRTESAAAGDPGGKRGRARDEEAAVASPASAQAERRLAARGKPEMEPANASSAAKARPVSPRRTR
jgi:hypothetical protein